MGYYTPAKRAVQREQKRRASSYTGPGGYGQALKTLTAVGYISQGLTGINVRNNPAMTVMSENPDMDQTPGGRRRPLGPPGRRRGRGLGGRVRSLMQA